MNLVYPSVYLGVTPQSSVQVGKQILDWNDFLCLLKLTQSYREEADMAEFGWVKK